MAKAEGSTTLEFVKTLEKYAVLINKSQKPHIKKAKAEALKLFIHEFQAKTGILITEDQLKKRINNIKTDVKKKSDLKSTGNKTIKLKEWEHIFLKLINADQNPSISRIPGGLSVGSDNHNKERKRSSSSSSAEEDKEESAPLACQSSAPAPKRKRRLEQETEETISLTNSELQRLVLLENLKLLRMQQELLQKRLASNDDDHSLRSTNASENIFSEDGRTFCNL